MNPMIAKNMDNVTYMDSNDEVFDQGTNSKSV